MQLDLLLKVNSYVTSNTFTNTSGTSFSTTYMIGGAVNRAYEGTALENINVIVNANQDVDRTVKYGNTETGTVPFSSLGATITSSNAASEACKVGVKPSIPHQCYACWSADLLLSYSQMKFESYITTFSAQGKIFNGNDYYLKHLWHIHQVHIYDSYFSKMFDQLIPMLNDILNQLLPKQDRHLVQN